ncbi:hypothetical protein BV898_04213 [Hypsibius exemplaris]|uniref:Uncharacterized protein n=1 Tax=Hypsibius exemplaris TaxID=2072580 RepID=A0A1W0X3D5_HYPEX|nr:hypothetical protein BV898_04213 [Hypsibius exemplaris]
MLVITQAVSSLHQAKTTTSLPVLYIKCTFRRGSLRNVVYEMGKITLMAGFLFIGLVLLVNGNPEVDDAPLIRQRRAKPADSKTRCHQDVEMGQCSSTDIQDCNGECTGYRDYKSGACDKCGKCMCRPVNAPNCPRG